MSDLFKCGFCDFFFGLFRRAVCPRNRRGSSDTCYRELGGENTVHKPQIILTSHSESTPDLTDVLYSSTDSSCPEGIFLSCTGRFEKELAKIFPKNVTISWNATALGDFSTIKRQGVSSKASPVAIDDCYPKQAELLLSKSEVWEFDTFHLDQITGGHCLPALGMHLFKRYDLIKHFNLEPENCWKLFHLIEMNYHAQNPYHNSVHASDVAQAIHCFLQQPPLLENLRKIEILVVLLAAFTHDLDHPGVNQSYLVATHHPLAAIYKDNAMDKDDRSTLPQNRKAKFLELLKFYKHDRDSNKQTKPKKSGAGSFSWRKKKQNDGSILECHHWRVAFGCIGESEVFDHMVVQLRTIKTMLKELILATDITRQSSYLEKFRNFLTRKNLDMNIAEHRLIVMQIALKTADISNPGRPWPISQKWSEKVCEEFYSQGDKERQKKIPISKLCDRSQDTVPSIQIGFFENIVMPLYTEWHRYLETELSLKIMNNVVHNAAEWKRQAERSNTNEISRADQRHLSVRSNYSRSTERLLQEEDAPRVAPRRHSYSPTHASKVKDVLRRFSSPLHALVAAPRIISEAQRGDPSAWKTPRRYAEEIHRSRSVSRQELATTVEADSSGSQERLPPPRPAARTPARDSLPPLLRGLQLNGSPRSCAGVPAKDDDSTNGVCFGSFEASETISTSGTTTAYPQQSNTVTGSSLTPSTDSRLFPPITLDNASSCAAGSEVVVLHVASREECFDVLPRLIAPELMRRRGSAPVVVATPTPRWQAVHAEPRKLSASCNVMADAMPPVRRGSLPVMTGISAL